MLTFLAFFTSKHMKIKYVKALYLQPERAAEPILLGLN
jgi:hypothetical protein